MKVDNHQTNRLTQAQTENPAAVDRIQRAYEGDARLETLGGKDKASLSEQARLLARVRAELEETPELRSERVNQVREQYLSGNYEVPVEALAKRMLSRLKEL